MTLIGRPAAASILGMSPVGVVLPSEPSVKVRLEDLSSSKLRMPVLTMHTKGDGLVVNQDEQAYASIIEDRALLRQVFVDRAGHCAFTPAETVAAFNALVHRIDTGEWSGVNPARLNAAAAALKPLNVAFSGPSFIPFRPTVFLRPFSIDED